MLEPAVVARLLIDVPDVPHTLQFSHALVREVVLADISTLRRARFHRDVANALAEGESDDNVEILADHLWLAMPLGPARRPLGGVPRREARSVASHTTPGTAARAAPRSSTARCRRPARPRGRAADDSRLASIRRMRHGYASASSATPLARARELAVHVGRPDALAVAPLGRVDRGHDVV